MALTTDLDIYKSASGLLSLAVDVQANIPRAFRASMGNRIADECVELLITIGRANAARTGSGRAAQIETLLERLDVARFLLHQSPTWLSSAMHTITEWLPNNLGLHLNPSKTIIQPVDRGVDFVGQVIKPWRRTTRKRTLATALDRLEHMPANEVHTAGNSYLGLVRQASHSHKERAALCRALLKRDHVVEGLHLSKAYPKNHTFMLEPV